jgi:hypothetical protein
LVSCRGAFHPKLVVLAGDEDVWVAIGSGNPTMSGWGHNHELWLVLRASRKQGPAALRDLGYWLIDLPRVVTMPSWIAKTVINLGQWITPADIDDTLPDLRIFGNLHRSLLGQLPAGPVLSLRMTAPFFDARAQAVRALIERFSPAEVDIAMQKNLSQYNGQALSDATSTVPNAGFWFLDEDRTRHGKLVEWTTGGGITALTGSANLSAAAMLTTTSAGGNCELVTTYPIPESLLPKETFVDRAVISTIDTIPVEPREASTVVLTLLGARRINDTVLVELVTTATQPITIATSPDGTPGTWMPVHIVSAGAESPVRAKFSAPERLGGAVRASVAIEGERVVSDVAFLTDTHRCLPRNDTPTRPKMGPFNGLDEVFTDPVQASRFNANLLRLLSHVQEHKGSGAVPLRTGGTNTQAPLADDRWGAWLHDVERSLGSTLTGLLFPGALILPESGTTQWSVGPETDDTALADGEHEDVIETLSDDASGKTRRQAADIPPSQRQQYRNWARRWAKAATTEPRPPLDLRMLVARSYIDLLAAGVWGTEDNWRADLGHLVQSLVPTPADEENTPDQAMLFTSSLIAVCLALLFQDTTLHGGDERDVITKTAWGKASEWAAFAEPVLVEEYLYVPDKPYARVPNLSEVTNVIDLAVSVVDDIHAEFRIALRQEEIPARQIDNVWVIDGKLPNPRRTAARAATLSTTPCAILARNAHKTSLILRDGNTIIIAESVAPLWRIYQLRPLATPLSTLCGDEGLPRHGKSLPLEPVPPQVRETANTVRVNLTLLLAALRTPSL